MPGSTPAFLCSRSWGLLTDLQLSPLRYRGGIGKNAPGLRLANAAAQKTVPLGTYRALFSPTQPALPRFPHQELFLAGKNLQVRTGDLARRREEPGTSLGKIEASKNWKLGGKKDASPLNAAGSAAPRPARPRRAGAVQTGSQRRGGHTWTGSGSRNGVPGRRSDNRSRREPGGAAWEEASGYGVLFRGHEQPPSPGVAAFEAQPPSRWFLGAPEHAQSAAASPGGTAPRMRTPLRSAPSSAAKACSPCPEEPARQSAARAGRREPMRSAEHARSGWGGARARFRWGCSWALIRVGSPSPSGLFDPPLFGKPPPGEKSTQGSVTRPQPGFLAAPPFAKPACLGRGKERQSCPDAASVPKRVWGTPCAPRAGRLWLPGDSPFAPCFAGL